MTSDVITLDRASQGRVYTVTSVDTDSDMRRRLCELGMINGTEISPIIVRKGISSYRIRGAQIALRSETASRICVKDMGEC